MQKYAFREASENVRDMSLNLWLLKWFRMNKLKSGLNVSDSEDNTENQTGDVEEHNNEELTNGHSDGIIYNINGTVVADEAVRPLVNGNHEAAGPSGSNSAASSSSQAFGGARPKTQWPN